MTEPDDPAIVGEILPATRSTSRAVAWLSRGAAIPAALADLLDGKLGDAVAVAAEYAGDSLSPRTREKYLRRWDAFCR